MRFIILLSGMFASISSTQAQDRPFLAIRPDMVIDADILIQRAEYTVNTDSWIPIIIEGENIDVNFNDAVLFGNSNPNHPEFHSGIAIIVRNAKNVKIRNLRAYRFKKILHIENSSDIIIDNCDFSYLYRPPIFSNEYQVSELDKTSFSSTNLFDLGAAVYAKNVHHCQVNNSKISNSLNGIILENCDSWSIFNNNIMFNSASGIVISHGSGTHIRHNRLDFNTRSSQKNYKVRPNEPVDMGSSCIISIGSVKDLLIANNSLTHSESGLRMLNDRNSGLPERCTISANFIAHHLSSGISIGGNEHLVTNNRIEDCPDGIVLYESNATLISDNEISTSKSGIWASLSKNTVVANNLFKGQENGIIITQKSVSGKKVTHEKRPFTIVKNHFISSNTGIEAHSTSGLVICENYFEQSEYGMSFNIWKRKSTPKNNFFNPGFPENISKNARKNNTQTSVNFPYQARQIYAPTEMIDGQNALVPIYPFTGQKWIIIDEYGPYDFRYPFIDKIKSDYSIDTLMKFGIYGPWQQSWTITESDDLEFNKPHGIFPDTIAAIRYKYKDSSFQCKYTGSFFTDRNGQVIPFNDSFQFQYHRLRFIEDWKIVYQIVDNKYNLDDIAPLNLDSIPGNLFTYPLLKETHFKQNNSGSYLELFEDKSADKRFWEINTDQQLHEGGHILRLTMNGKILFKMNQEIIFAEDSDGEIKTYLIPIKINSNEQKFEILYLASYDQTVLHLSRHYCSDPVKK